MLCYFSKSYYFYLFYFLYNIILFILDRIYLLYLRDDKETGEAA